VKAVKASPQKSDTSQPFENFESPAKSLTAVPKKELDKELAKHEREKERKKKTPAAGNSY
jgi:hypothetical protein